MDIQWLYQRKTGLKYELDIAIAYRIGGCVVACTPRLLVLGYGTHPYLTKGQKRELYWEIFWQLLYFLNF